MDGSFLVCVASVCFPVLADNAEFSVAFEAAAFNIRYFLYPLLPQLGHQLVLGDHLFFEIIFDHTPIFDKYQRSGSSILAAN